MRIFKYLTAAAGIAALAVTPQALKAQESSLGTYSPYTMYGLGNLNRSPQSTFAAMGGVGIGFRNGGFDNMGDIRLNISNPAALSSLGLFQQSTFIFDVGLGGTNQYLSQRATEGVLRTSFNTFNFNNITMAMTLAKRLGLAFSVSPYSEVGYKIHTVDESYLGSLGSVDYDYVGQGDVTEAKLALGWEIFKNFSVGAEMNYLWGNIDRSYEARRSAYTGTGTYYSLRASTSERIGRMFGAFGLQYTPLDKTRTRLTLGATYRPGRALGSTVRDYIPSNNIYDDVVRLNEYTSPARMPQRIGAGLFFHRPKWALGADYVWEDWAKGNAYDATNDVRYVNSGTLKVGGRYTPSRFDMRGRFVSFFNRMTYKAGFRTGNNYLQFQGVPMNERAVSFGVDVPFRADKISGITLGVEYGERGTLNKGLVRERFFKVNVGVMFFGSDYDDWFQKYKYN
jgi:hypothetical protein